MTKVKLPQKFTHNEMYAYCWLVDCGIAGWAVDLKTKQVYASDGQIYSNLVEFANMLGMGRQEA